MPSLFAPIALLLVVGSHHAAEAFIPVSRVNTGLERLDEILHPRPSLSRPTTNNGLRLFRRDDEAPLKDPEGPDLYDLIVVGSGNGACALVQQCLEFSKTNDLRILVLEQGDNFFFTSDVTHQNGWSKSYASGGIYRLHNSLTPSGKPVLSGRACTMGGGGSINYTMIHESSRWLTKHIGHDVEYWDTRKAALNKLLDRPDPFQIETPFCKYIQENAIDKGYAKANKSHLTENIPSYQDGGAKQLYIFPTQFNEHGQRTNSGVSLVDWSDPRLHLRVNREVTELMFEKNGGAGGTDESTCLGVKVKNSKTGAMEEYKLEPRKGKLILCGGSASPRLLMRSQEHFGESTEIGKFVNDHICMPLAVFSIRDEEKLQVGPTDNYGSLFAMSELNDGGDDVTIVNVDFFSGSLDRLAYLASSLYLAFVPFNGIKIWLGRNPFAFTVLSNVIRILLAVIIFAANVLFAAWDIIRFQPVGTTEPRITTTLIKFNANQEGQYEKDDQDQITLAFFEDHRDHRIAEEAIKQNLEFIKSLGDEPWPPLKGLFRCITKIPYDEDEVADYVKHFSQKTLLSEQHLSGGCIFGKALDRGEDDPAQTAKVFGSSNVHVADLSAVPLPRVSTQMTAYLVGHHVGHQLFAENKN